MSNTPVLVLGTRNPKKGEELKALLEGRGVVMRTSADFPDAGEIEEDGTTFAENAEKKAAEYARRLKHWVLGEDSGLCVDALGGAPGVFSARFAGDDATDEENNRKLLDDLAGVPLERRTACYVCRAALSDADGNIRAAAAACCRGRIRAAPVGNYGFGYDPLFEVMEYHRTFGELGPMVKSALSHRARALRQIVPAILRLLREAASSGG